MARTRAPESFRRASEIDSSYVVGYIHALPLALSLGDTAARGASSDLSQYVYGMAQVAFYDGTGAPDVRRGIDSASRKTTDPLRLRAPHYPARRDAGDGTLASLTRRHVPDASEPRSIATADTSVDGRSRCARGGATSL